MTLAKGLGSGLPIGAMVAKRRLMSQWKRGAHGNTYGGNPLACAAANATIDLVEGGLAGNAADGGRRISWAGCAKLARDYPCIGEVRGKGLMIGMELVESDAERTPARALCDAVITRAFHNGLLLLSCGASTVRFMPPLNVTREEIDEAIVLLRISLDEALPTGASEVDADGCAARRRRWRRSALRLHAAAGARAGAQAGRPAAQLLLARALPAAADHRPLERELHARRRDARLQHGRFAVAAAHRHRTRRVELTHATGAYDYQPDVARDGRSVVFTRYDGNAMELWRLDLAQRPRAALTRGGAVNVEPRLSPDGKRIAWVSTQGTGHFNLFIADIGADGLRNARPLLGERKSAIDRYYYSAFDHAINPSWSPDGKRIVSSATPRSPGARGDIWSVAVDDPPRPAQDARARKPAGARARKSHRTAGACCSPAITAGSAHQLWLTTPPGAAPLPLTFGDCDRRNARWSPDGTAHRLHRQRAAATPTPRRAAMSSAARTQPVDGEAGAVTLTPARALDARHPRRRRAGSVPARVAVLGSDGRAHAPDAAWMHADDGFDRARQRTETHYFHCASPCTLDVPAGDDAIWPCSTASPTRPGSSASKLAAGRRRTVRVDAAAAARCRASSATGVSADLHVHMNYGGHYRNTPREPRRGRRAPRISTSSTT